jgi:hypothetical protein
MLFLPQVLRCAFIGYATYTIQRGAPSIHPTTYVRLPCMGLGNHVGKTTNDEHIVAFVVVPLSQREVPLVLERRLTCHVYWWL